MSYSDFIESKRCLNTNNGFKPLYINDKMFDFQKELLEWSVMKGSSAIFADCGLGKSICELAWGENIVRKTNGKGEVEEPVCNPHGLLYYAGERNIPEEVLSFRNYEGKQTENRFSHWIWRQYASCMWDDIRINEVLKYKEAKDDDDEKHVHPLQLDVINRIIVLRSNKGDVVFTPFMGVGSEVFGAVANGRKGVGVELKSSYYKQAVINMNNVGDYYVDDKQDSLF